MIYALSWYLDIVCEQWKALVWPSANDFSIVMPLPVRRKFGRPVLYQPLFCQYLGIFSRDEPATSEYEPFLRAVAQYFPYISNYAFNPDNLPAIHDADLSEYFGYEVFQTHWLDLRQPYAELYAGYSADRKLNLKRGLNANWEIIESDDFETLIKLFNENHAGRIGKIKSDAYRILEKLGKCCVSRGFGKIFYAREGLDTHAGVLLVHCHGRTIYLFNAANHAGRKGNARLAILDAWFRSFAGIGTVFDFESPQNEAVARYYGGFGTVAMPFCCIKRNALPFPFRQIQNLRKWLLVRTS